MEINKSNFNQQFSELSQNLLRSQFISFSLQLTGELNKNLLSYKSTSREWYKWMRNLVKDISFVQLGISAFIVTNQEETKFKNLNYTLWVNPFECAAGKERDIMFDTKYIGKLNENNPKDWNKSLKRGIPYVNYEEYKELTKIKENLVSVLTTSEPYAIGDWESNREKEIFLQVLEKFSMAKNRGKKEEYLPYNVNKLSMNIQKNLVNYCKKQFWGNTYVEIKDEFWEVRADGNDNDNKDMKIRIMNFTEQEAFDDYMNEVKLRIEQQYLTKVGLSEIFFNVINAKKIVVGYDMSLEIAILYQHLFQDLPDDYIEYKRILSSQELNYYDLKVIIDHPLLRETFLFCENTDEIYKLVVEQQMMNYGNPSITSENKAQSNNNSTYYSYMYGYLWIKLYNYWANKINEKFIDTHKNLIYITNSLYNMSLNTADDILIYPNHNNLFFVKNEKKNINIAEFVKYLNLSEIFEIRIIGDNNYKLCNVPEPDMYDHETYYPNDPIEDFFLYITSPKAAEMVNKLTLKNDYVIKKFESYLTNK